VNSLKSAPEVIRAGISSDGNERGLKGRYLLVDPELPDP
jgi:hypothetical protein